MQDRDKLGMGVEDDEDEEEEEEEDVDMGVKEDDEDEDEEDEEAEEKKQMMMMMDMEGIGGTSRLMPGQAQQQQIHFQQMQMMHMQIQQQQGGGGGIGGAVRKCRPKEEKERTKLRERHRRAITARILAGLRRHGNYNLRVRADINDVIAALAKEAGWVVLPDGTTLPPPRLTTQQNARSAAAAQVATAEGPLQMVASQSPVASSVRSAPGFTNSVEYRPCHLKGVFVPTTSTPHGGSSGGRLMGGMGGDGGEGPEFVTNCTNANEIQVQETPQQQLPERVFAGTAYIPVYVMLPLGVINLKCELVDPDGLIKQLKILKSANIDGVMIECWWGIVEAHTPQTYNWSGYKDLFKIIHELKLKLQVVFSFQECGGNIGDDVCIPLPHWIVEIGRSNPDIFFTDREGRRNPECLTWGIDKERVLRGRTALEVYFDFMRSFCVEFDDFFECGTISGIEVGLGPSGELRYPSHPVRHNWRYPGIGEFQCYDQYLLKNLSKAAEKKNYLFWARGPGNAGTYNSRPQDTGFFCDGGDYDSYYGRFFLSWYSRYLIEHADRVLSLARFIFEGKALAVKISGIYWWYKTANHAAELTAGFYNSSNRDGYAELAEMLKKHDATLNIKCGELRNPEQQVDFPEAMADPEGLTWQMLNSAWDVGVQVASENALPCHDRDSYNKILDHAKPLDDPDRRHLSTFTYLRLSPALTLRNNFLEFERFVKRMHGFATT